MRLQDSFVISASKDDVWSVFMNAERLAACVPGCTDIRTLSPTKYEARMEVKVPFMTIPFQATGELKHAREGEELQVEMIGQPFGLAGMFRNRLQVLFQESAPTETMIHYRMELQMTGRLASLGDVLMRGTVKRSAGEFAQNVQALFDRMKVGANSDAARETAGGDSGEAADQPLGPDRRSGEESGGHPGDGAEGSV